MKTESNHFGSESSFDRFAWRWTEGAPDRSHTSINHPNISRIDDAEANGDTRDRKHLSTFKPIMGIQKNNLEDQGEAVKCLA